MLLISPEENQLIDRMARRRVVLLFAVAFIVAACHDFWMVWERYVWASSSDLHWVKICVEASGKLVVAALIIVFSQIGVPKDRAMDNHYAELHRRRGF